MNPRKYYSKGVKTIIHFFRQNSLTTTKKNKKKRRMSRRCILVFFIGLVVTATAQRACTPADYLIAGSSDCTSGRRTLTYALRSGNTCVGAAQLTTQQSCECHLNEYSPSPSSCDVVSWTRPLSGWQGDGHCTVDDGLKRQLESTVSGVSVVPCECTSDDVGSQFTACDAATSSRTVIFYWKRPCTIGNYTLPNPSSLGCRDECDDGQYLGPPNTECKNCSSGTYSIPGVVYSVPWTTLPNAFHTSCIGAGC